MEGVTTCYQYVQQPECLYKNLKQGSIQLHVNSYDDGYYQIFYTMFTLFYLYLCHTIHTELILVTDIFYSCTLYYTS